MTTSKRKMQQMAKKNPQRYGETMQPQAVGGTLLQLASNLYKTTRVNEFAYSWLVSSGEAETSLETIRAAISADKRQFAYSWRTETGVEPSDDTVASEKTSI